MRGRRLLLGCLALALAACQVRPHEPGGPPPAPATGPEGSYYEAPGPVPAPLREEVEASGAGHEVVRVLLPPRLLPEVARVPRAADPIEILWFRPRPRAGRRPLVLLSPVLGNRTLLASNFARRFAARGFHAAIVFRKETEFDPRATLEGAEEELRVLVMRSRQALDWLLTRPDVDPGRLGTFGVSAGAVIGSLLAGTDPRLRVHVLYLAGGPFADVVVDSEEARFRRYGAAIAAGRGLTREDVRERLRREVRTDPLAVAPRADPRNVLLLVAARDRSVPTRHGLALWEAMGRPELVLTPFGHRTTFVLLPWLETLAADFFARRFGAALAPPGTTAGGGEDPPPVVR